MQHNTTPTVLPARPARRAKTQAMQHIREYTQRQLAAQSARPGDLETPKYDEYGLMDTDSDDSDFNVSESDSSSDSSDDEEMDTETED
jgi:hypothetical protein